MVRLRRAAAAKLLAVCALLSVPGAQLAVTWHEMTVRHVVCADHGEMSHVVVTGRPAETSTGAQPASSREAGIARQSPIEAEGHEHCTLALVVQSGHHTSLTRGEARYSPPPVIQTAPAIRCPDGGAVVLASAPKTSPPPA